ncbi:MAG: dihydrolipoyl dehydrogenase [Ktedonobacteraceae bacterium]
MFMVVGDVTTAVDVLILGAGPGGYVAAIRTAQLGRHVTIVEPGPAGGTCLNHGCIPLKALISVTERYQQMRSDDLSTMGIHAESVSFDWTTMQTWKQGVVDRLSNGVHRLLDGNHVEVVKGIGWFINAQEVRVEGEYGTHRFKFEDCIIATGAQSVPYNGKPASIPEEILQLSQLPQSISIIGDDYIALELATLFARLGVKIKLYSPGEQLLAGVDSAALRLVQAGLRKLGIEQSTTKSKSIDIDEIHIVTSEKTVPNTNGLHLDAIGMKTTENGGIAVNTMQQTSIPHIYAVGDCTGSQALASIAIKQGKVAAEVLAGQRVQFAPLVTPLVVHTTPELATVGYTADEATKAGYTVSTGRFPLAANGRALTLGTDNGVAMIVATKDEGVLLGATLVGPRAGDIIGQLALAIEMGATLTDLDEILYAHPGLSETIQESAENALGRAIHILTKH